MPTYAPLFEFRNFPLTLQSERASSAYQAFLPNGFWRGKSAASICDLFQDVKRQER
jgi:hypothetical protein